MLLLPMEQVLEPEIPAREGMDAGKLDELKESLAAMGQLQPILVTDRGGAYEIVAGHRRYLAARALGWRQIQAVIFDNPDTAREAAMIHENVVREDLNPAEEAVFIAQLIDKYKLDEAGICKMMCKGANYIADRLRLLRNDQQVFQALREGKITFATARELNKFDDETMRRYYLDAAIRSGCASRVVTDWLNNWRASKAVVHETPPSADVGTEAPVVDPYRMHCEFCGGDKDPYNLVTIQVHRWELEEIKKVIRDGVGSQEVGG